MTSLIVLIQQERDSNGLFMGYLSCHSIDHLFVQHIAFPITLAYSSVASVTVSSGTTIADSMNK